MNRLTKKLPAVTAAMLLLLTGGCVSSHSVNIALTNSNEAITLAHGAGRPELTYRLMPPTNSALPVASGGYFHPLTTPSGVVVTDFAPADHLHHRGVFLAWVEMHGEKSADFWGWGEHAPIRDRRIVNRSVVLNLRGGFTAVNDWMAEDTVLIEETLTARSRIDGANHVLDLTYHLVPRSDITLARWAFSGFCVRTRKDGSVEYFSSTGPARFPAPSHIKPESDWPDAPWYAAALKLPDGVRAGVAVVNHPDNPPTLWHNHPDIRMLNPCIVAPASIRMRSGQPLVLRYRVVAFDGSLPEAKLDRLAASFRD